MLLLKQRLLIFAGVMCWRNGAEKGRGCGSFVLILAQTPAEFCQIRQNSCAVSKLIQREHLGQNQNKFLDMKKCGAIMAAYKI
jgi:hypothetical protein